jgi:xanthine dehydrogenase/oxidase
VNACWDQLKTEFDVERRRTEIAAFNRTNRWKKRGLALVPTKFGISFTAKFMNQG